MTAFPSGEAQKGFDVAMAEAKTNAMRMLDKSGVSYESRSYETKDGLIDGVSVAHKLGQDPNTVFKTLVTKAASGKYYVFDIPVHKELDLKKAAKAVGEKSVAMIPVADINKVTGYIRGGCSPVGMKKEYPTVIDQSAGAHEKIMISAGRIGTQLELSPKDLAALIHADFADLTAD